TASALISAKIVVPNSRIRSTRKGVRGVGGMSGRLRPMNREALLLTLAAALLHATWNFAAKRAEGGGPVFVWGYAAASAAIWVPVTLLWAVWHPLHPGSS